MLAYSLPSIVALARFTQCSFSVGQVVATHTYMFAVLGVPGHMQMWVATRPATFEAGTPQKGRSVATRLAVKNYTVYWNQYVNAHC